MTETETFEARFAEAQKRIADAEADAVADGHDWDVVAWDVIQSVALDFDPDVRAEILRTELGLVEDETDDDAVRPTFGSPDAFYLALGSPRLSAEILDRARARRAEIRSDLPVGGYTRRDYR